MEKANKNARKVMNYSCSAMAFSRVMHYLILIMIFIYEPGHQIVPLLDKNFLLFPNKVARSFRKVFNTEEVPDWTIKAMTGGLSRPAVYP